MGKSEPDPDEDFDAWFVKHLAKRTLAILEGDLAGCDYQKRLDFMTVILAVARTAGKDGDDSDDDTTGGAS